MEDLNELDEALKLFYLPIQKMQVTDVSTLSEDWATNSQHD